MPAVIDKMLPQRVALHRLDGTENQVAADLHVCQFLFPLGQSRVQQRWKAGVGGIVYPVAALDNLDGFLRRAQLAAVLFPYVHDKASFFHLYACP